ncbi:MAG TPA: pentapeptide repeat-containing protein [Candidatus Sulfotelmatobacter sp.]|nr:pentapeptide repeat-containing protein [Candidatus Sulfotelmatobacter sp.]
MNAKILDRLVQGKPLDGLALGIKDGRVDLAGLVLPATRVVRQFQFDGVPITESTPGTVIQAAKWTNLDFTGTKLKSLGLYGCELTNCVFDRCLLQDIGVWATAFRECSFRKANLRNSGLGGVQNGKRTIYSGIDFSEADLRDTSYQAAAFERCVFRNAKLEHIDFDSSTFADCVFEGELRDVIFYRRGFKGDCFPPNEMRNVDFSRAKLHALGFRGLTLDQVKLPDDAEHIIIRNVGSTVNRLIGTLNQQGDATAKKLIAFLSIDKEWRPPNQVQMVINTADLAETVGDEGVERLLKLLGT